MSTVNNKELMKELYDAALVTAGVVGLSMVSEKVLGEKLTDASTLKDTGKLEGGVAVSTMLVKWAQDKKYIPTDPFSKNQLNVFYYIQIIMASVIGWMLQTAFASLAFAGSGYLFKMLDKNNYEAEIKRHNKALEDLSKAKDAFYENETKQQDGIQQLRQQLSDANDDIEQTNKALDMLRQVQSIQYNGKTFNREHQLNDFYQPSDEMKEYQYITIGSVGIGTGYILSKYI